MNSHRLYSRRRNLTPSLLSLVAAQMIFLGLVALPAAGQLGPGNAKKASLEVVADRTAYAPGATVQLIGLVEIDRGWHVNSNTPSLDWLIATEMTFEMPEGFGQPRIEYPKHKMLEFEFTDEAIAVYEGRIQIRAQFDLPGEVEEGTHQITATLLFQACDHESCVAPTKTSVQVPVVVGPGGQPAHQEVFAAASAGPVEGTEPPAQTAGGQATGGERSLPVILLFAVIGGLLLNAMPCVLPVLSIKVFGLVQSAAKGRSHVVKGCLATAAGVLVSFMVLAAMIIGAKMAGEAVGWGMQFQHPGFVTFMAVVVVLFSLNLWGLFEVPLPQSLARLGSSGPNEGMGGHFATGLFATLMATPCSAPYLAPAIGFALSQSAMLIFAIFLAVGVGLAMPYLLLAVFPGAAKWLPKPGEWMLTFKGIMGFLLVATAIWLFYVLAAQVSTESLAYIQATLLLLALFTWLMNQNEHAPVKRRLASIGVLATAIFAIVLAVQAPNATASENTASGYHAWLEFDEAQAKQLRDSGKLVFVDFTADWCFTCKTNERLVIETAEIASAFEEHGVVTMKADWTNPDEEIASFLGRYGKSAVPFYLLYRPDQEPHVFGELLTKKHILSALEGAS